MKHTCETLRAQQTLEPCKACSSGLSSTQFDRLEEIKEELKELVHEAGEIVRRSGDRFTWDQARGYWYAHMLGAIDKDNDFLGGSMVTMEDTIRKLEPDGEQEDEDDDEDGD